MSDLRQDIYVWLTDHLTMPIFYGTIPEGESFEQPVLSFIRLPSLMEQNTGTTNAQYQFSIRCRDLNAAEDAKEELIQLIHKEGQTSFDPGLWLFGSEVGTLVEDEGRIFHCPVLLNLKYVR